ncbi:DNA-binding transcriptional LysR family regulator [Amaricoccus macauensis]|uniref:DNA-binding transcriptional LysR family regulator n=1 Tax=Amaricoccus macauensis TaxID=57001 RepID=A0A840SW82_9RHOB|nr:LysR family transcriptional regulator [Amaricoccus macauensis]MBB5223513.1 DNA-binding transcriptional LysR family regulator [Amaricoccus macauensis]
MDWDKLRIFHAVADAGSLTHAGETLHLSQSAVSRQIRALEESLSTTLFRRHARGLLLTEQGELLFDATRTMSKRLEATAARIRDSEDEVHGELRVTTTMGFGTLWLAPRLSRLFARYPNLKIELMLEERILDLSMREADVAIRLKEPSQAELIRRRLMDVHIRLYASAEYVAKHGFPRTAAELAGHRIITQSPQSPQVRAGADFVQPFLAMAPMSSLTVNNYFGILQAVREGLGIGSLPDYLAGDFPELEHILPEEHSASIPTYLAYVEELKHSKRVTAFRDFIIEEISTFKREVDARERRILSHASAP